jgi:hypothetical protein
MKKRKMYSFRANMEDIDSVRLTGDRVGEFIREAISEKLERISGKILESGDLEKLPKEDRIIAIGNKISLLEREIERIKKNPDYLKCQENSDLIENYTPYVLKIFGSKDYNSVKEELARSPSSFKNSQIQYQEKVSPTTTKYVQMTFELLSSRWLMLKASEETSENLKRAYGKKIAKIEAQIDDYRKQIANLASGV